MPSTKSLIVWDAPRPEVYDSARAWDRQPCDDDTQWAAFRAYLMLPVPRRTKALHGTTGVPYAQLAQWCTRNHWVLRAQMFDRLVHETWQEAVIEVVQERAQSYAEQHAETLSAASELLRRELDKYLRVSRETEAIGLLRPAELTKLLELVIKLERLHYGETTDNIETTFDLSALPLEDLKMYKRLNEKAGVK